MQRWLQLTLVISSSVVVSIIAILIIRRCFCDRRNRRNIALVDSRSQTMQSGIQKLHQVSIQHLDRDGSNKRRKNHYVLGHGVLSKRPLFSWDDHPSLITDAVENGWPRFAFTTSSSSASSVRSSTRSFLSSCAAVGDQDREMGVEINWEVSQASADFMQKIRFINSALSKRSASVSAMASKSVVRTAMPLPGPLLRTLAFPQEAYFEITIIPLNGNENLDESIGIVKGGNNQNSEKAKLITEDFNAKGNPESLIHGGSSNGGVEKVDEFKAVGKQVGKGGNVALSVGLGGGGGGPLPLKLPGSYAGSIGFNSNGSVYLDGTKLVEESEKEEWGQEEMVIGCGYNPAQKNVFFTVDSQLVHEIHCQTEEFGTPLYPILAANIDITVLINLGQCAFKYAPANLHRTQNPCFIGPMTNSPSLGYEDSKELFSMGRIDSHWYNRSTATRSNNTTGTLNPAAEFDGESEGDLFEIVLDNAEKSHYYG